MGYFIKGKTFRSCVECREYHRTDRKENNEAILNNIELLTLRYNRDEVFRRSIADRYANRVVVYIICDYCRKMLKRNKLGTTSILL